MTRKQEAYVSDARGAIHHVTPSAKLINIDFSNLRFDKLYFLNTDFAGSDLSGADLSGCCFHTASLRGTDFSGANLTRTAFFASPIENADFSGADLTSARWFNMLCSPPEGWAYLKDTNTLRLSPGSITKIALLVGCDADLANTIYDSHPNTSPRDLNVLLTSLAMRKKRHDLISV